MKKQLPLLIIVILLVSFNLYAQEAKKDTSYWVKKTQFGATLNNAGFSNSWAPGGQDATGINLFFNKKGEYAKDKTTWVNDLQLQYGLQSVGSQSLRKSIDRLFFDTKVGRKLSKNWSLVGGLNFQTQFSPGYKYGATPTEKDLKISNLFAPAFITEYIGFEWKPKPFFNIVFAPGALRQTIVGDDEVRQIDPKTKLLETSSYGVPIGQSLKNDIGIMQIVASFDKDVATNVNLKLRYQLFVDANKPANTDNRLDAKLAAKINKYFSATFDLIALYDDDLGAAEQKYKIQTAHNIGLGFLYTF